MRAAAPQATLETARLLLRPFCPADLERLVEVAGQRSIADTTVSVPHPFTEVHGHLWIKRCTEQGGAGAAAHFAMARREAPDRMIGYVAIKAIKQEHGEGELSFWLDERCAGAGYASEAARAAVDYAFDAMGLNRVCAFHMVRNGASGRVLARAGLREEGVLRQAVRKWGVYEDVIVSAIVRDDWVRERRARV